MVIGSLHASNLGQKTNYNQQPSSRSEGWKVATKVINQQQQTLDMLKQNFMDLLATSSG
jgi:hypothetical protein